MAFEATILPDTVVTCVSCEACCCRLEVILITDTEVPDKFIAIDQRGARKRARLEEWLVLGLGPKHDDLHDLRGAAENLRWESTSVYRNEPPIDKSLQRKFDRADIRESTAFKIRARTNYRGLP